MRSPARFLQSSDHAEPPSSLPIDSDIVVILAALLCGLISVVGLALVARCAWHRRSASAPPNKGLKKKAVQALPTLYFDSSSSNTAASPDAASGSVKLVDCAICLADFADGDVVRVLPQCGHGFHTGCIDTWLRSHSSCPSCRRILVVTAPPSRCQRCGATHKAPDGGAESTFLA
ncbi:finger protein [Musa troglodytarum]|uniref:Finger protein n=1 Tax=Musa troglodytarum TaxID=320322 RepID=A0A9E7JN14_9LILI|nr:finger protein [Musa troglodytarum]